MNKTINEYIKDFDATKYMITSSFDNSYFELEFIDFMRIYWFIAYANNDRTVYFEAMRNAADIANLDYIRMKKTKKVSEQLKSLEKSALKYIYNLDFEKDNLPNLTIMDIDKLLQKFSDLIRWNY